MSEQRSVKKKRREPRLKLESAPPIKSIKDLITIGNSIKRYNNIDTLMVWRIAPYLEQLDALIGMESLKKSIFYQLVYYIQGMHLRNKGGEYLHTIIMGNPGCGKTSVARIIGKLYQAMGVLSSRGVFKIAHRDDFIAGYLGQTAKQTRKLLDSCIGGVLFIDEVYALGPGQEDKDSFSKEALDILTGFLSEHTNDFCCIAAGYEKEIQKCFFAVNPGLKSRFPWVHKIEPYSQEDLAQILTKMVDDMKWEIAVELEEIASIIGENLPLFESAGRDVETYVGKCKMAHASRTICLPKQDQQKFILTREDLEEGIRLVKEFCNAEEEDASTYMHMYM